MAKVKIRCKCNNEVDAEINQCIVDDNLVWYLSYNCLKCGSHEEDGIGITPQYIREKLISEYGEWKLTYSNVADKTKWLKVIRKILDLTFRDISKIAKQKTPYVKGTKMKIERLMNILENEGVKSSIDLL